MNLSKKLMMEVLRILLYVLLSEVHNVAPVKTTYKLVSGLQMERVPSPSSHFYKEYVPLVYQFSIPRWNKTSTTIYGSQTCNTTNYTKFFTTCPVLYYLNEMHERFSEYFGNNQPLVANLEDISAKPETALIPFDCELIRPHFEDIFVDKVTLDEYLSRLKSCSPLGSQEFIQGITNYVYNVSGVYLKMKQNFYSEYWLKIDLIDGRVDAALWANAINTINSLMFQNYMMEANRWKMAVMDCEAGRIPSTILPPTLLSDTLVDMLESLSSQNLFPTVSTDAIGNYYKSKLTDCTFTNDTFLVRLLIPVIPSKEKFLLVKMTPLPFYYHDEGAQTDWQCQIDSNVLPSAAGAEDGETYILVDLVKNIAYESNCKPGKLCHIPTALHPRKVSPCATAAFNWERYKANNDTVRMDLVKHCPIKCSPLYKYKMNMLTHIAPLEFFWFHGDSSGNDGNVIINCSSIDMHSPSVFTFSSSMSSHARIDYGSQTMEVGCDCELKYQSQIHKPKPCNSLRPSRNQITGTVQVNKLAPIQWYSGEALKQNKIKEFWNVPEQFFETPVLNLIRESIGRSEAILQNAQVDSMPSSKSSSIFIMFFTLLFLALAVTVVGLAWRLHSLIRQLEGMGFNVKGQGTYNVAGSTGGAQQVSYRNMGSLVDTDSLLINEDH